MPKLDGQGFAGFGFPVFLGSASKLEGGKMITGIDLNETLDYVCNEDKENPTTWKLGIIPSREMARIASGVASGAGIPMLMDIVKKGLRGWENFKVAGEDIKFNTDARGLEDAILDIIPINIITELGTEILKINKLGDDDQKN